MFDTVLIFTVSVSLLVLGYQVGCTVQSRTMLRMVDEIESLNRSFAKCRREKVSQN